MAVLLIGMVFALYAHDALVGVDGPAQKFAGFFVFQGWTLAAVVVVPKVMYLMCLAGLNRATLRRADRWTRGDKAKRRPRWLGMGATLVGLMPMLMLVSFVADLAAGWLVFVRNPWPTLMKTQTANGFARPLDVVLLDEMAAMLPVVLTVLVAWWLDYPVRRRIREATLLRSLDQAQSWSPMPARGRYVWSQVRLQLGLLGLPLLLILAWHEGVLSLGTRFAWSPDVVLWLQPVGGVAVLVAAPWLVRLVWDTPRLPDGELREDLQAMCVTHRVRVRDLLLWKTGSGLINAAVLGFIPGLRYILISDGLVERLSRPQLRAVMAHEIAHVRYRHPVWLLLIGFVLLMVSATLFGPVLEAVIPGGPPMTQSLTPSTSLPDGLFMAATFAGTAAVWLWGFGWVSRRLERQADTFAARHLSQEAGQTQFDVASTTALSDALDQIVHAGQARRRSRSWRHGSIALRQAYLANLVGQPLETTQVDRTIRRVQGLAILILIGFTLWVALS